MDILASPPLRVGSIAWQEQPGQWTLTVVCKATFALTPGTAALAPEQEDVNEQDNHWDDDPQRSVYAPSDLAPFKPCPEVTLVGSAFAPHGQPTRALSARLLVGEVDKSIEVFGQRAWGVDGALVDGPGWTQMPLRYERAAGGPESWNPVGVLADAVDPYGRRALPNLQAPGVVMSAPDVVLAPIGFGPLAATWRVRREKLRQRAATWSDARVGEEPLGESFDGTFFQAAPLDQRLEALRADEQLILEHLHPDHARLVTRLPGVRPRARVEAADLPSWELTMLADTLWIDTNRALCTVTWRGQIPLDRRDQAGIVRLDLEEAGRRVSFPSSPGADETHDDAPRAPRSSYPSISPATVEEAELLHTFVDDTALPGPASAALAGLGVLPFQKPLRLEGAPPAAPPPKGASGLPKIWEADEDPQALTAPVNTSNRPQMPTWLATSPAPSLRAEGAPPRPPPAAPALLSIPTPGHAPPLERRAPTPPAASSSAAPTGGDKALATATYAGVLASSNAAAGAPDVKPAAREPAATAIPQGPRALVDLIWHDAAKVPRLRRVAAWAPFFRAPPPAGASPEAAEEKARADRADVLAVLSRAAPVVDVEGAVEGAASEDGALEAPFLVAAGELELPFDEIAMLEALLGAASPLSASDKKLKEVIDLAGEVMKTPLGGSPGVAGSFIGRVREAWSRANRLLPADYLDVHTRRLLLEKRAYQRRQLSDEVWLRALLTQPGESAPIPAYLPEAVARWLPLFARFPARLLAEAVPQQDQSESHPAALRVMAVARVVTGRARAR